MNRIVQAREGLHQYRSITYHSNAPSLGKVILSFREEAENRLKESREALQNLFKDDQDCTEKNLKYMYYVNDDLDVSITPEIFLTSYLLTSENKKDKYINPIGKYHREYNIRLRFVWEVYKMILELLRATPKLERIYHDTVRKASLFCNDLKRPHEFKKICDIVRAHYVMLVRNKDKPDFDNLLRIDYQLETRLFQLNITSNLNMWKESLLLIEEVYNMGIFKWFYHMLFSTASSSIQLGNTQSAQPSLSLIHHIYQQTLTMLPINFINNTNSTENQRLDMFINNQKTNEKLCRWVASYIEKIAKVDKYKKSLDCMAWWKVSNSFISKHKIFFAR